MSKTKIEILPIDLIRIDGQTQARIKINEDAVDDYAEVIKDAGGDWPFDPIDVFFDGSNYFVADGFHRTLAAIRMKRASIPCRVHQGTAKDAKIFGMTANDTHGIRMTREDKRACVEWLLDHGGSMTQDEIATKAGVTSRTVRNVVADRDPEKRKVSGSSKSSSNSAKAPKPSDADKLKKQKEKEAEKAKKKVEAAAAKAEAKEAAMVAKEEADRQSRSPDEQAKLDCSVARQLIQKATRSVDDLNRTKKSPPLGAKDRKDIDGCISEISGPSITRRMTVVRILQLAERLLWQ